MCQRGCSGAGKIRRGGADGSHALDPMAGGNIYIENLYAESPLIAEPILVRRRSDSMDRYRNAQFWELQHQDFLVCHRGVGGIIRNVLLTLAESWFGNGDARWRASETWAKLFLLAGIWKVGSSLLTFHTDIFFRYQATGWTSLVFILNNCSATQRFQLQRSEEHCRCTCDFVDSQLKNIYPNWSYRESNPGPPHSAPTVLIPGPPSSSSTSVRYNPDFSEGSMGSGWLDSSSSSKHRHIRLSTFITDIYLHLCM